jgi:hypothetical protein
MEEVSRELVRFNEVRLEQVAKAFARGSTSSAPSKKIVKEVSADIDGKIRASSETTPALRGRQNDRLLIRSSKNVDGKATANWSGDGWSHSNFRREGSKDSTLDIEDG